MSLAVRQVFDDDGNLDRMAWSSGDQQREHSAILCYTTITRVCHISLYYTMSYCSILYDTILWTSRDRQRERSCTVREAGQLLAWTLIYIYIYIYMYIYTEREREREIYLYIYIYIYKISFFFFFVESVQQ